MASKRSPTNRAAEPPRTDDLKLINGIGPAVEKRLNGVGIFTFTQLAALSPADVAAAVADLTGLSAERIVKQDWIGQARKLAAKSMQADAQADVEAPFEQQAPMKEHALSASHTIEPQQTLQPTAESLASEVTNESELLTSITASSRLAGTLRLREIENQAVRAGSFPVVNPSMSASLSTSPICRCLRILRLTSKPLYMAKAEVRVAIQV